MRVGDVASSSRPDRQRRPGASRRAEDQPRLDHRRRDDLEVVPAAAPQLPPRVRVVGVDRPLAADDELVVVADPDRHGRSPPDALAAGGPPDLLAGRRVVGGDETAAPLILVDDELVAVEQRRARRPVVVGDAPHLGVPQHLAVEVERGQSPAAQRDVHPLAVGGRSGRRRSVLLVRRLRRARRHLGLPAQRPVAAPVGQDVQPAAPVAARGQEDVVAPDDGRRVAASRHGRAPDDVVGGAPAVRVPGAGDETLAGRTAPAGPVPRPLARDRNHPDGRRLRVADRRDAGERAEDQNDDECKPTMSLHAPSSETACAIAPGIARGAPSGVPCRPRPRRSPHYTRGGFVRSGGPGRPGGPGRRAPARARL